MISFRITQHTGRKCEMVEVFNGARFVAALYTDERDHNCMRLVSSHVKSLVTPAGQMLVKFELDLSFEMEQETTEQGT